MNCTMVEMARNMFHAQNFNKSLWTEVMANVFYTRNWCPTRAVSSITLEGI